MLKHWCGSSLLVIYHGAVGVTLQYLQYSTPAGVVLNLSFLLCSLEGSLTAAISLHWHWAWEPGEHLTTKAQCWRRDETFLDYLQMAAEDNMDCYCLIWLIYFKKEDTSCCNFFLRSDVSTKSVTFILPEWNKLKLETSCGTLTLITS